MEHELSGAMRNLREGLERARIDYVRNDGIISKLSGNYREQTVFDPDGDGEWSVVRIDACGTRFDYGGRFGEDGLEVLVSDDAIGAPWDVILGFARAAKEKAADRREYGSDLHAEQPESESGSARETFAEEFRALDEASRRRANRTSFEKCMFALTMCRSALSPLSYDEKRACICALSAIEAEDGPDGD